jgi:hypothetical protein
MGLHWVMFLDELTELRRDAEALRPAQAGRARRLSRPIGLLVACSPRLAVANTAPDELLCPGCDARPQTDSGLCIRCMKKRSVSSYLERDASNIEQRRERWKGWANSHEAPRDRHPGIGCSRGRDLGNWLTGTRTLWNWPMRSLSTSGASARPYQPAWWPTTPWVRPAVGEAARGGGQGQNALAPRLALTRPWLYEAP